MDIEKSQYYTDYSRMIFNYFCNKIVQLYRPIYLTINYTEYDNIYGQHTFPSQIILYLKNIIDKEKHDNLIKIQIIYTIIHELFHCDQLIYHNKYDNDNNYNKRIEQDADYETSKFIIENKNEIEQVFRVDFSPLLEYLDKHIYFGGNYNKRTNEDYIVYNIFTLFYDLNIVKKIKEYETVHIYLNNRKRITIKSNNIYSNNLFELTEAIYQDAIKYDRYKIRYSISIFNEQLLLYIETFDQLYTKMYNFDETQ